MMENNVKNYLQSDLEPEISGETGSPGTQTGGSPADPPKGHLALGPGGECFAPLLTSCARTLIPPNLSPMDVPDDPDVIH